MSDPITSMQFQKHKNEIESRFYALGKRIADFASLIDDIKDLREENSIMRKNLAQLSQAGFDSTKSLSSSLNEQESMHNSIVQNVSILSSRLTDLSSAHAQMESKITSTENALIRVANNVSSHESKLGALHSIRDDIAALKENLSSQQELCAQRAVNASCESNKLTSIIQNHAFCLSSIQNRYDANKQAADINLQDLKGVMAGLTIESASAIDRMHASLTKLIEDKIAALPKQIAPIPFPESRIAKIESQVNLIEMDSKTALLKTSNLDLQTQIHNKKIENLQATLKQQELTQ